MGHLDDPADPAGRQASVAAEFWHFLKHSKKWWLLPFALVLVLLVLLMVLSDTVDAPFVYRLF